jgi:hypothetical protein
LEFAHAAGVIDLSGVVALPPAVEGGLGDAELAADIGDVRPLARSRSASLRSC